MYIVHSIKNYIDRTFCWLMYCKHVVKRDYNFRIFKVRLYRYILYFDRNSNALLENHDNVNNIAFYIGDNHDICQKSKN